jgi:large subunit ribosomal protein L6
VSRVGKYPITIPSNVTVNYDSEKIEVQGPKGKLSLKLRPEIILEKKDNLIEVKRNCDEKLFRSLHGLYRVLINNMIIGVNQGFAKKLEIVGTGYKAAIEGKKLVLNLGYSYPYVYNIPEGIKITVDNNVNLSIEGIDKQLVGEVAAEIRKMRPPEPYKGKGIKYENEVIRKKAGKAT